MDGTRRGMRAVSAGLLGLLLATAVLLAILLLDGQPAHAQAVSGSETDAGQALGSGMGRQGDAGDNLDGGVLDPAPLPAPEPFQAAEDDARQLLQDMDQPLAPMVLAQRPADPGSRPDRTGGERPAGQGANTTPDWAQVTVQQPPTRDDPARGQDDPQGGDPKPTGDDHPAVVSTATGTAGPQDVPHPDAGTDAGSGPEVEMALGGGEEGLTPRVQVRSDSRGASFSGPDADLAELDADGGLVAAQGFLGGPGPDPERQVAAGGVQPSGPAPAGALLAAQQTDPAATWHDVLLTPQDHADRDVEEIRGEVDTAVRYAKDFAETADRTGERLDVAMASLTAAWVQMARAVAGAAENAAAATRNGVPGAWRVPHDLTVTDVGFVLGTVELGYPPPAVRLALGTAGPPGDPAPATPWTPSFMADWARHAAQFSQVAARTALELTALTGHADRTAEGRSQLAWAARCSANASQAAANIAHEASQFDPDDPRMANDAKQAQEYADRAAAQADAAAVRLGKGTRGAESDGTGGAES